MTARSLLFAGALAAGAVGVWAGVNYAGTDADAWIRGGIGLFAIAAGVSIFFSPDPSDQQIARLHGGGFALFGLAQFFPWPSSLPISVVSLALMVAGLLRRRAALRNRIRPS